MGKLDLIKVEEEKFNDLLKSHFCDHSLNIHGIKSGAEPREKIARSILTHGLFIGGEGKYNTMSYTVQPFGLIMGKDSLEKADEYVFSPDKDGGINMYIVIPITFDINNQTYFWGYPQRNDTGDYPIRQKDFTCLVQKVIDELGYIPSEFVLGYKKFSANNDTKEYVVNKNHIAFKSSKEQSDFYRDIIEQASLYFGSLDYRSFNIKNSEFLSQLAERFYQRIDFASNTAHEYVEWNDVLRDQIKLIKK